MAGMHPPTGISGWIVLAIGAFCLLLSPNLGGLVVFIAGALLFRSALRTHGMSVRLRIASALVGIVVVFGCVALLTRSHP